MQINKEIIVESLNLEDFILLQEILSDTKLPIGDTQKYMDLTTMLDKVNAIVQAFED